MARICSLFIYSSSGLHHVSPFGFCMTTHTDTATSNLHLPPRRGPRLDIPQTVQGQQEPLESGRTPSYLVISGGTGCNAICAAFALSACYVLPVSDNGGSSSEIIRVLGGPSIGKPFFSLPLLPIDRRTVPKEDGRTRRVAAAYHWRRHTLTVTSRR
jgi:hypothetical protein